MSAGDHGGAPFTVWALVALSVVGGGVLLYDQPYITTPPGDALDTDMAWSAGYDVPADLSDDPVHAVARDWDRQIARLNSYKGFIPSVDGEEVSRADYLLKLLSEDHRIESVAQELASSDVRRFVLISAIQGGDEPQFVESRRRHRFAVLSALMSAGYVPRDDRHLGFLLWNWRCSRLMAAGEEPIAPSEKLRCIRPTTEIVPYEWFNVDWRLDEADAGRTAAADSEQGKPQEVLVVWLPEQSLLSSTQGEAGDENYLTRLDRLVRGLCGYEADGSPPAGGSPCDVAGRVEFAFLGPAGSDGLAAMSRAAYEMSTRAGDTAPVQQVRRGGSTMDAGADEAARFAQTIDEYLDGGLEQPRQDAVEGCLRSQVSQGLFEARTLGCLEQELGEIEDSDSDWRNSVVLQHFFQPGRMGLLSKEAAHETAVRMLVSHLDAYLDEPPRTAIRDRVYDGAMKLLTSGDYEAFSAAEGKACLDPLLFEHGEGQSRERSDIVANTAVMLCEAAPRVVDSDPYWAESVAETWISAIILNAGEGQALAACERVFGDDAPCEGIFADLSRVAARIVARSVELQFGDDRDQDWSEDTICLFRGFSAPEFFDPGVDPAAPVDAVLRRCLDRERASIIDEALTRAITETLIDAAFIQAAATSGTDARLRAIASQALVNTELQFREQAPSTDDTVDLLAGLDAALRGMSLASADELAAAARQAETALGGTPGEMLSHRWIIEAWAEDTAGKITLIRGGPAEAVDGPAEVGGAEGDGPSMLSRLRVYSSRATMPDGQILGTLPKDTGTNKLSEDCEVEDILGPRYKNASYSCLPNSTVRFGKFRRTLATDDEVAGMLVEELKQRGIPLDSKDGRPDTIAIVSEHNALFGRQWTEAFANKIIEREAPGKRDSRQRQRMASVNQQDTIKVLADTRQNVANRAIPALSRIQIRGVGEDAQSESSQHDTILIASYFRGLHGGLTRRSSGDGSSSDPGGGFGLSAEAMRRTAEDLERPAGKSQLDYLRRLASEVGEVHRRRIQYRPGHPQRPRGVQAVIIIGGDYSDKMLLLQAFRQEIPDALYITNDLDERWAHPANYRWSRNLVIGSAFGTKVGLIDDGSLPFRESYQSSSYVAVLLALADVNALERNYAQAQSGTTINRTSDLGDFVIQCSQERSCKPPTARIFEIGRFGFVELTDVSNERQRGAMTNEQFQVRDPVHGYFGVARPIGWPYTFAALAISLLSVLMLVFVTRSNWPVPVGLIALAVAVLGTQLLVDNENFVNYLVEKMGDGSLMLRLVLLMLLILFFVQIFVRMLANLFKQRWLGFIASYLVPFGITVIMLGAFVTSFGAAAASTNFEPMSLVDGVSVWPTEALRLLAGLVAVWAIAYDLARQDGMIVSLAKRFAGTDLRDAAVEGVTGPRPSIWRQAWAAVRRQRSVEAFSLTDLFRGYRRLGGFWRRLAGMVPPLVLHSIAVGVLFLMWEPHWTPARGEWTRALDQLMLFFSVATLIFVVIYVVKASHYCDWFVRKVAGIDRRQGAILDSGMAEVAAPDPATMFHEDAYHRAEIELGFRSVGVTAGGSAAAARSGSEAFAEQVDDERGFGQGVGDVTSDTAEARRLEEAEIKAREEAERREYNRKLCLGEYLKIKLVAEVTQRAGRLILLPFALIFLMIVSRTKLFDYWVWIPPFFVALGLLATYSVIAAVQLRRMAERSRTLALEELRVLDMSVATGEAGVTKDQLDYTVERIENESEGAFNSWFRNPILRAVLLPFSGVGAVALLELLAT